jgi:F-type H+-transporting ATPase subunit gamma
MANLKDLRLRIKSVKSTKKITTAMKLIAAAKLKKAQEAAQAARPYAREMTLMLNDLLARQESVESLPRLLRGNGQETHLLVVITSNRGLCGAFNSSIVRQAKKMIRTYLAEKKNVHLITVGKKSIDMLRQEFGPLIIARHLAVVNPSFSYAESIASDILHRFDNGEFDVCTVLYNSFVSALDQQVTAQQLIPFASTPSERTRTSPSSLYDYEPSQEVVLDKLLERNIKIQVYHALLESTASENGARMAAMDGATRNATTLINTLNLTYNRMRQAQITTELIEIISGAEAL